jgi:hypothetical protein
MIGILADEVNRIGGTASRRGRSLLNVKRNHGMVELQSRVALVTGGSLFS